MVQICLKIGQTIIKLKNNLMKEVLIIITVKMGITTWIDFTWNCMEINIVLVLSGGLSYCKKISCLPTKATFQFTFPNSQQLF